MAQGPGRPLLRHIPPRKRTTLMRVFLDAVGHFEISPADVVTRVLTTLQRRLQSHGDDAYGDVLRQMLVAVRTYPDGAIQLAHEAISGERYEARMASRPPRPQQLAYLRQLGVEIIPANRLDACRLLKVYAPRTLWREENARG
jgi:hypothetical protein